MQRERKLEIFNLILNNLEVKYGICFILLYLYKQDKISWDEVLYFDKFLNELYTHICDVPEFYNSKGELLPDHFKNGYRFKNNEDRKTFLIKLINEK